MTENILPDDTAAYLDIETAAALTVPDDAWITAGRANALVKTEQQREQTVKALQSVLEQAPLLRTALRSYLQKTLKIDPDACGLNSDDSQVTLLDFAARVLSSAVFANPFAEWSTWGLADHPTYQTWTGRDWVQLLNPLLVPWLADTHAAYWDMRMPGHAVSRRSYTEQRLAEHFQSTLELNYGLDGINDKALQLGKLDSSSQYAQLYWQHPGTAAEVAPGALLIKPPGGDAPWLLYRPDANNPIRSFQSQAALLSWSHEHRQRLWPNPDTPLDSTSESTSVVVKDLATDGLAGLLNSVLKDNQRLTEKYLLQAAKESETDPLDWSLIETWEAKRGVQLKATLPASLKESLDLLVSADDSLAAEELHFDSLNERLPLGWRKQRIERQEKCLADYLGSETEPASAKMQALREYQAKLDQEETALQKLLAELPDTLTPETWGQKTGESESSRFDQLSQHFARNLLLEARFQQLLGDLSETRLQWIENLIERPEPSLQRPVVVNAVTLMIGARAWTLTGYLAIHAIANDDDDTPDSAWLLYKAGHDGGLSTFTDQTQLTNALLKTLYGAWPETLLESAWPMGTEDLLKHLDESTEVPSVGIVPITTHVFDYLTQTQLTLFASTSPTQVQNLGLSANVARIQAFERLAEKNRTAHIHTQLQALSHLNDAERIALAAELEAFRRAMLVSSRLLERDLPERGRFARNKLHAHLRQAFSLSTVPEISLDIADKTSKQRVPLPESGFANAFKEVVAFSPERSKVPLEKFLLRALDDDLTLRLGNATILFDDSAPTAMREQLNLSFVANLVKNLDLAGAYEQQILDAFKGQTDETAWAAQLRQETLRLPFEHQLSIISLSRSTHLDAQGQQLLELFCQEQGDSSLTRTVDYYTLELKPGVAADGSSNRVDLSGVFILKAATGPVLLLLPDMPGSMVISQYASTEEACRALEDQAVDTQVRSYLANLPLEGDAAAHLSYINTAVVQKYSGFIGLGSTRQEPLAQFQANLQMGRSILEHRTSSRSQRDLFLEQEAIRHGRVYNYIKMALGLVPLVGAGIALYDGWNAANASVEAFLRGDAGEGIEHLNSVFLSLIDALFDLTPGSLAVSSKAVARTGTRQQLPSIGIPRTTVTRRHSPEPFTGYASEVPAGRWLDHPQAYGKGVLRHAETGADYITHQGRFYQVEWDASYRTWRLKGTASRTYKQPVKLSEAGFWQTHGSLSGQIIDNGLAGGGAYLSTLYNRGWQTLRGYLRPQPALLSPVEVVRSIETGLLAQQARMTAKTDALNRARGFDSNGQPGTPADAATIKRALQEVIDQLDEFTTFHEQSLDRLQTIRSQVRPAQFRGMYDELAFNLGRQHPVLIRQRHTKANGYFRELARLDQALDETTVDILEHFRKVQSTKKELAVALEQMEAEVRRIGQLRNRLHRDNLTVYDQDLAKLNIPLDPHGYRVVRLASLALGIFKIPSAESYDFLLMLRRINREILKLCSSLYSHGDLAAAGLSRTQEHRFLLQLKQRYQRFNNHMLSWQDSFPDFITSETTRQMRQALSSLIKDVDSALSATAPVKKPASHRGPSKPRLFETVDQQLLIGREVTVQGQRTMVVKQTVNSEAHTTYTAAADGKWQPAPNTPAIPSSPLASLVATANKHLAGVSAQRSKLQQFKRLNMLPADLEDLAQGYATTLRDLAADITRKAADELSDTQRVLVQRLEQAADDLDAFGRQLRIEQIKTSQQPNIAHLQYLHEHKEVSIHWSRTLEPAKNKQGSPVEYLEEYRIDDSSTQTPLWYAHFHFKKKPGTGFARLEAGHLKLASEVNQSSGVWRGPVTESQATALFGGLRPNDA